MASPVVEQAIESSTNTAGTSHVVTLPTATAGQLLLIILDKGSTAATINSHASLTELLDENSGNGLYIAYRQMDGTEPASYTLTSSASTRSARIAYRISGAITPTVQAPQIGTTATGTSATPDPPSSASPGSTQDYLFIAFFGKAGEEADDDTWANTPPTNYTPSPPRQKSCGTAGTNLGGLIASAERQLTTGSAENPGTFGVDVSAAWRAQTIMISPSNPQAVTPSTATATLASFAPTVLTPFAATIAAAALTLSTFAPTVTTNNNQDVTPATASLTTAGFAPSVTATQYITVTPSQAALTTATFAPSASVSDHVSVTPSPGGLNLSALAPSVAVSMSVTVTPPARTVQLTAFAPSVMAVVGEVPVGGGGTQIIRPVRRPGPFARQRWPRRI